MRVLLGQSVYVPYGTVFAAFDARTGQLRWKDEGPVLEGPRPGTTFQGRPAIGSDRLYAGGRDGSYALKK